MTAPSVPAAIAAAFEAIFADHPGAHIARLCGVHASTITRERGPRVERYNGAELLAVLIDDAACGERRLLGAVQAEAIRQRTASRFISPATLSRQASTCAQDMLRNVHEMVGALADQRIDKTERARLIAALPSLIGHLSELHFALLEESP
jgi:hypothetical protein